MSILLFGTRKKGEVSKFGVKKRKQCHCLDLSCKEEGNERNIQQAECLQMFY